MFLRCKDTFNANKISSKILKNLYCQNSVQKYSREKYLHTAPFIIPPLYFNFSDFKTRGNIYIYIFFFLIYQANYHE